MEEMTKSEVEVESSEITEKLDENPDHILPTNISIPSDLFKYFESVEEGTEDFEPERIKFKCLLQNCGFVILYSEECGWDDFRMHLKSAHPTLDGQEEMDLELDTQNTLTLKESTESDNSSNTILDLPSSETVTVTDEMNYVPLNSSLPSDLKKCFQLVHEANDRYELSTFKCLVNDCGRTISQNKIKGWYNCRRHLKTHTEEPKPKAKSSLLTIGKKTVEIPIKSKSTAIVLESTRTLRVRLDRLNPDPSKLPTSFELPLELELDDLPQNQDLCFICGKSPDKQTLVQQAKILKGQRTNYSKAICRLLKIQQSESHVLNFMNKSKYCKECWRNMKRIAEMYVKIDKMENELLELRYRVEDLMRGNLKNVLTGDETADKGAVEIYRVLMEEPTRITSDDASPTQHIYSATENIFTSTDFNDDFNGFENDATYEEDDFLDATNCESVTGSVLDQLRNEQVEEFQRKQDAHAQSFVTKKRKARHAKVAHPKSSSGRSGFRLKCDKCDALDIETSFKTRTALKVHIKQPDIHPWFVNGIWTCNICSKTLTIPKTIKRHRRIHAQFDLTENNCTICSLKCSTDETLSNHMLLHNTDKPFHCVLCQIVLSSSVDLKRHMLQNHTDAVGVANRIKCSFPGCDKTFRDVKIKYQHESKLHRGIIGLKCPHPNCDVVSNGKCQLELHLNSHSDEKKFQCDICGAQLKYRKGLARHRKSHLVRQGNGKFDHECKICSKSFESSQRLRRHEEIHSGLKDKLCDICGKSFGAKQNLVQHYKTHFKDKYTPVRRKRDGKGATASSTRKISTSKIKKDEGDQAPPMADTVSATHCPEEVASEYVIGEVYSLTSGAGVQRNNSDFTGQTLNPPYDETYGVITSQNPEAGHLI